MVEVLDFRQEARPLLAGGNFLWLEGLNFLRAGFNGIPFRVAVHVGVGGFDDAEVVEEEGDAAGLAEGARFLTEPKDLDHVSKALKGAGWTIISAEIRYLAKNFTELGDAARKEVADFLNALDDHDDVHRVYAAMR